MTPEFVEQIIAKEEVDAILLSFGGQTALNCGLALHDSGVLEKYGVQVLGTPVESIRDTEDRAAVRRAAWPRSTSRRPAARPARRRTRRARQREEIGFPGHAARRVCARRQGQRHRRDQAGARRARFGGPSPAAVRRCWSRSACAAGRRSSTRSSATRGDNCITVCNMENLDPMGIHTGESIVVAPSQTLNDEEYQLLRAIAIQTVRHLGIVGECNIQYALDPDSRRLPGHRGQRAPVALERPGQQGDRLSAGLRRGQDRLGYTLPEIPNRITRRTTAFFEPALDYIVCKVPRWDLTKFQGAAMGIGSEMKSVGEVMAIGRTFPEVIQKALRMLDIGVNGLDPDAFEFDDIRSSLNERDARIGSSRSPGASARA